MKLRGSVLVAVDLILRQRVDGVHAANCPGSPAATAAPRSLTNCESSMIALAPTSATVFRPTWSTCTPSAACPGGCRRAHVDCRPKRRTSPDQTKTYHNNVLCACVWFVWGCGRGGSGCGVVAISMESRLVNEPRGQVRVAVGQPPTPIQSVALWEDILGLLVAAAAVCVENLADCFGTGHRAGLRNSESSQTRIASRQFCLCLSQFC